MDITHTTLLQPLVESALENWLNKPKECGAFFLYGKAATGKTTCAYRVLKRLGYRVVEFNASHTRTGTAFRKTILPLLHDGGVSEWLMNGNPDKLAVLLDEIDGLSTGERGGLQELLAFLRAWKPDQKTRPLILISNSVEGRSMEQLIKQCVSMKIKHPDHISICNWLGKEVPQSWTNIGDLREILRLDQGISVLNGESFDSVECSSHPESLDSVSTLESETSNPSIQEAWHRLYDKWEPYEYIWLANNETNLAGLILHENLPQRLEGSCSTQTQTQTDVDADVEFDLYDKIFNCLCISDKADFFAFFHQCWPLLKISQELKLLVPQQIISKEALQVPDPPEMNSLIFTRVLSKQSSLFNGWKEICKSYDNDDISIRLIPVIGGSISARKKKIAVMALPIF